MKGARGSSSSSRSSSSSGHRRGSRLASVLLLVPAVVVVVGWWSVWEQEVWSSKNPSITTTVIRNNGLYKRYETVSTHIKPS